MALKVLGGTMNTENDEIELEEDPIEEDGDEDGDDGDEDGDDVIFAIQASALTYKMKKGKRQTKKLNTLLQFTQDDLEAFVAAKLEEIAAEDDFKVGDFEWIILDDDTDVDDDEDDEDEDEDDESSDLFEEDK
jgi:hypothetical protein